MASLNIPGFYCPSRRTNVRPEDRVMLFSGWTSGGTDYGGCIGRADSFVDGTPALGGSDGACAKPLVGENIFVPSCMGVFMPNQGASFSQIKDGTSNTIATAELQRLNNAPTSSNCASVVGTAGPSEAFPRCSTLAIPSPSTTPPARTAD